MDCIPQNSYVGALTFSIPDIEDKIFECVIKLKWRYQHGLSSSVTGGFKEKKRH